MKKIFYLFFYFSILIWSSCEKETNTDSNTNLQQLTLNGIVLDENGNHLSNAAITLKEETTSSDGNGSFSITAAVDRSNTILLKASFPNFLSSSYSIKPNANNNNIIIVLSTKDASTSITVANGGSLTLSSGAKIEIPSNAVTLYNGDEYTGNNIEVVAKEINEDIGPLFSSSIPGNTLTARNILDEEVELVSFGMLRVELYGDNGEPLQIKDGVSANLTFKISSNKISSAPSSIPLWYFDEEKGVWQEEGAATKQGNYYIGSVSHFTAWNCDLPHPPCTISGCIVDTLGIPRSGLPIQVNQILTTTDSNGCFSASVPAQFLPINIKSWDYSQMIFCDLHTLNTSITPSTNHNLGTFVYAGYCGYSWRIETPNIIHGGYNMTRNVRFKVTNSSGNGYSGVIGNISVVSGSGSISNSTISTNSNGLADITWTMGATGSQRININILGTDNLIDGNIIYNSITDPRDGQTYATVTIGTQTWIADNLRYDTPDTITNGKDDAPSPSDTTGYTWGTTNTYADYYPNYGRYYSWASAQYVCPSGWHLPSDSEWKTLEMYLGMSSTDANDIYWRGTTEGDALKSTQNWSSWAPYNSPQGNGSNNSGFNAYPAGFLSYDAYQNIKMTYLGVNTLYWTSDPWFNRGLTSSNNAIYRRDLNSFPLYSCRCIQD